MSLIPELVLNSMNYLISLGLQYDPAVYDPEGSTIEYLDGITYKGVHHFATKIVKIQTSLNYKKTSNFIYTAIPELIHGTFFMLNGIYYVPGYYINDEPIVMKEHSINFYSLFQPLTLFISNSRVIFMKYNIRLDDFLQIICYHWDDDIKNHIRDEMGIDCFVAPTVNALNNMGKKINCLPNINSIKDKLNLLFFDNWTRELYQTFYNIPNPNFEDIIKLGIIRFINKDRSSFIDLRNKRLCFIEYLLKPYFKAISIVADQLTHNLQPVITSLKLKSIISHFFTELDGNHVYNNANGYSSTLAHKASFKNPFGKGNLPTEVSGIHWSHEGRICVSSISNHDPGSTVYLIADQEIDTRFGIFNFDEEERRRKD